MTPFDKHLLGLEEWCDYAPPMGVHEGMTDREYHAMPGVSSSALAALRHITPAKFRYSKRKHETDAQRFGTAVHLAMLQPDLFRDRYVRVDCERIDSDIWQTTLASTPPTQTLLKAVEYDKVLAVADHMAYWPCSHFLKDIKPNNIEKVRVWRDSDTGILCKSRDDFEDEEERLLGDLKTTSANVEDVIAIKREIKTYGYHARLSHYDEGIRQVSGWNPKPPIILFVEKEYPYQAKRYQLHPQDIEDGRQYCKDKLTEIFYYAKYGWPGPDQDTIALEPIGV